MTAVAADVTGTWSGTFSAIGDDGQPGTPDGAFVVLKQSGATITGSGGPDANEQWPIQNGKIVADKITAEVVNPDGTIFKLTMTVNGDHIAGEASVTREGQNQKAKIELTRVK
jgi:hypothetical protein